MSNVVLFLLLGLGVGAAYASLALALVITYRSSGVVNFAAGAIALYSAYTYAYLRHGQLVDPIPGLPATVRLSNSLDFFPALLIALLLTALLGCFLYLAVFRFLRNAVPLARVVASVGVLLCLQALFAYKLGTNPATVGNIFPTTNIRFAGALIPSSQFWIAGYVIAIAIIVALLYRYTRFGIATQAVAENEKGAIVTGLSTETIALTNWAISAVIAGLAGILVSPLITLVPTQYTLFIVPALAACIAGSFLSITVAVACGLAIGMAESLLTYYQSRYPWLPQSGLPELLPVFFIVIVIVRGRLLPERGGIVRKTLGRASTPHHVVRSTLGGIVLGVIALALLQGGDRGALVSSFILGIIALSWVVVSGYSGQVSLAQVTLAGVGGFAVSGFTSSWHIPFPLAPILAGLVAALFGAAIGMTAIRLRGLSVAAVTLTIAVAIQNLWFNNNALDGGPTGGHVEGPSFFGANLEPGSGAAYPRMSFCLVCLGALVLAGLGVIRLRTSRLGEAMLAVRANERSAAAAGIPVAWVKVRAFALSGFIAGVGGALLAYQDGNIEAATYDAIGGLSIFAVVYIAGITSVSGGVLAGILATGGIVNVVMNQYFNISGLYPVIVGVGLIVAIIRDPEGIVGRYHLLLDRYRLRRRRPLKGTEHHEEISGDRAQSILVKVENPSNERSLATLSVRSMRVAYGGFFAVDGVDLDVCGREVVGLIGPNGAGKTTLIDAISGFTRYSGTVDFCGGQLEGLRVHQRASRGLARTFQGVELYEDLTVRENLRIGQAAQSHGWALSHNGKNGSDSVDRLLELIQLQDVSDWDVRELSHGQRQLLSVARSLAGEPRILLLDEPAAGLDQAEGEWLGQRLLDIAATGVGILLVDHDMNLVLNTCQRLYVLDFGKLISSGKPSDVRVDPLVVAAYLGGATTLESEEGVAS